MSRLLPHLAALRPYGMHVLLLGYTPILLAVDGTLAGHGPQLVLGLLTFAVLQACLRPFPADVRLQAWICVPVAILFEVFGSLVWGGYHYRLHTIPLYVPPGHALVYLFGVSSAALPLVRRHRTAVVRAVLCLASAWTLAGLTLLPLAGHRLDLLGAALWPLLAWCLLRSRRPELFAGIWLATATVEIAGTLADAWAWAAVAPWSHLSAGNPPSAIAAGYAVIDGSVVLLGGLASRLASRGAHRAPRQRRLAPAATR